MSFMIHEDARLLALKQWLQAMPDYKGAEIEVASADASFRRYFRITLPGRSYIAMDAPPDKEDIEPFKQVTELLEATGVQVPHVFAANDKQGFLLLADLGKENFLDHLSQSTAAALYGDALDALLRIQQTATKGLPLYDETLLSFELGLFDQWFLQQYLQIQLTPEQSNCLQFAYTQLVENALQQPQVFVHRDYHSRNLMLTQQDNPGVIDYQDAVAGPATYDLVSLLRDCYIAWPVDQVEKWALAYRDKAVAADILSPIADEDFLRWFDLMGVQRHLKAIGIFARLSIRDGKQGYLKDIPRTFNYLQSIAAAYPQLQPFSELLATLAIEEKLAQKRDILG